MITMHAYSTEELELNKSLLLLMLMIKLVTCMDNGEIDKFEMELSDKLVGLGLGLGLGLELVYHSMPYDPEGKVRR